MRDLLRQIETALDANLYYLALFGALTIPDICGAVDSDDGTANRSKYIQWFDEFIGPKYRYSSQIFLSGEDCYHFRCSLLHQGFSQHPRSTYARVIFVEPAATTNVFHCNVLNGALNIDVRIFCKDIIAGAVEWLDKVEGTEHHKKNMERFIQRYPQGLPPYIRGVPVIG
jgi:hypothetical protein